MLDDLDWAAADLDRAKTLYEECMGSGVEVDESWASDDFFWRMRTWRDVVSTAKFGDPDAVVVGNWNVSLRASGPNSEWPFIWTGDGFAAI